MEIWGLSLIIMKIIYSPKYNVNIGTHVFPTIKYNLVYRRLIPEYKDFIIEPIPANDEDVGLVHTKEYIHKLKTGTLTSQEIYTLELPYSKELISASWLCAGGTIMACKIALEEGCAVHLGGGFHHAFPDHGEGFCVLNDIAIGIKAVRKKTLVIDCDLHQGNGTAYIFRDNKSVFTFSIHQENNYPMPKPPSTLDIGLNDGVRDSKYMMHLRTNIPSIIEKFKPGLIVYVAGADVYEFDQLGGLKLTINGLQERDMFIFELAKKNNIPIAVVLAGGYAINIEDTVQIHYNTVKEALK